MRRIVFTKLRTGTFTQIEVVNGREETREVVSAERAFRRMTELQREGFREVEHGKSYPFDYSYIK